MKNTNIFEKADTGRVFIALRSLQTTEKKVLSQLLRDCELLHPTNFKSAKTILSGFWNLKIVDRSIDSQNNDLWSLSQHGVELFAKELITFLYKKYSEVYKQLEEKNPEALQFNGQKLSFCPEPNEGVYSSATKLLLSERFIAILKLIEKHEQHSAEKFSKKFCLACLSLGVDTGKEQIKTIEEFGPNAQFIYETAKIGFDMMQSFKLVFSETNSENAKALIEQNPEFYDLAELILNFWIPIYWADTMQKKVQSWLSNPMKFASELSKNKQKYMADPTKHSEWFRNLTIRDIKKIQGLCERNIGKTTK